MTNRIAFWIALLLVAAMLVDLWLNDGAALYFLTRKFVNLIAYVAFWR